VQAVVDKFGASDTSKLAADFDAHAQEADNAKDNPSPIHRDDARHPCVGHAIAALRNPLSYIKASAPPFLNFHAAKTG